MKGPQQQQERRRRASKSKSKSESESGADITKTSQVHVVDFATTYAKVVKYEHNKYNTTRASNTREQEYRSGRGSGVNGWHKNKNKNKNETAAVTGGGGGSQVLELRDVRKEVLTLGVSGLDRKTAKQWQGKVYEALGAKQEKRPRIPARIGKGIAKKKIEKEHKARELARETGMLIKKSSGKKRGKTNNRRKF